MVRGDDDGGGIIEAEVLQAGDILLDVPEAAAQGGGIVLRAGAVRIGDEILAPEDADMRAGGMVEAEGFGSGI